MISDSKRRGIPRANGGPSSPWAPVRLPAACADMESAEATDRLANVPRFLDRVVCRYSSHDWWALAYPPTRRWECHRCGAIVEETTSARPDRRRVPREPTKGMYGRPGTDAA